MKFINKKASQLITCGQNQFRRYYYLLIVQWLLVNVYSHKLIVVTKLFPDPAAKING